MKTLYLIFSKLKTMIRKDIFFFSVLLTGVLTCNLMFTYMYGILMQINEKDGSPDIYIYYQSGVKYSTDEISEMFGKYSADIDFYSLIDEKSSSLGNTESQLSEFVIRTRSDLSSLYTHTGNIRNLETVGTVIAPSDATDINIGDKIYLNGIELEVVGSTIIPSFIVSLKTFNCSGYLPDVITVDCSVRNISQMKNDLPSWFGNRYTIEYNGNGGLDENTVSTLFIIIIIYLLSILTFLYLMTSVYDDSAYEFNIYEMLGASRGKILTVLGSIMLFILAFASLISQAVHAALYKSFFSKMNMFGEYIYTFRDYAFLFAVTFISVYLFVFLYICIRVRKSAVANSRKFIS